MIIGFTGLKNSGKDTAAQYFVDKHKFVRIGYADTLKQAAAALFNVSPQFIEEQKNDEFTRVKLMQYDEPPGMRGETEHAADWSMREFLQRMGTEMGREVFGPNFWVDQLASRIDSNKNYVIPDVRFNNEAIPCNFIIEIIRDNRITGYDNHVSEQGIREELIDFIVVNNDTIEVLGQKLESCFQELLSSWQTQSK